jgi:hypothetical protein
VGFADVDFRLELGVRWMTRFQSFASDHLFGVRQKRLQPENNSALEITVNRGLGEVWFTYNSVNLAEL